MVTSPGESPASLRPPTFSYRVPSDLQVPWWTQRPALWRRAIELWRVDEPSTAHGLIHRNFHLGNVLWDAERLSGIIDWAETSWGPPDLDVAHMCSDFAMLHSVADAVAFRSAYLDQGGKVDSDADAARYWMVSDILDFLPDPAHILPGFAGGRPDLTADNVRIGLEDLLELTLSWG
ncbi:MAG: aminoglycoside phosphotransferase family protein [Microlunatus sp.]